MKSVFIAFDDWYSYQLLVGKMGVVIVKELESITPILSLTSTSVMTRVSNSNVSKSLVSIITLTTSIITIFSELY